MTGDVITDTAMGWIQSEMKRAVFSYALFSMNFKSRSGLMHCVGYIRSCIPDGEVIAA